jgi:ubiquinone/menaquinone biosynthesis C-methylase UbiE
MNQSTPDTVPLETSKTSQLIQRYYGREAEAEWLRLDRHRTELAVTLRALAEHLEPPPARLLDCGGGPGRYAIELARRGYDVTLFDLSPECLQMARTKATEAGAELEGFEQGSAVDLSRFSDGAFDGVLLLGPLYHLLEEGERRRALHEARRVLKPGGLLFAAFITRYAAIRYSAVYDPNWIVEDAGRVRQLLATGVLPGRRSGEPGFIAHYAHPTEVAPMVEGSGLEMITLLGVEGVVSMIEERVNELNGPAWDAWVDLNYEVASDPSILGCVGHLLTVARKPR